MLLASPFKSPSEMLARMPFSNTSLLRASMRAVLDGGAAVRMVAGVPNSSSAAVRAVRAVSGVPRRRAMSAPKVRARRGFGSVSPRRRALDWRARDQ